MHIYAVIKKEVIRWIFYIKKEFEYKCICKYFALGLYQAFHFYIIYLYQINLFII